MPSFAPSRARLREDLSTLIESKELALSNLQKGYLRSRWLEQMLQTERQHSRAFRGYYAIRLAVAVGCIFILLLVSLSAGGQVLGEWAAAVRALTIASALLVSVCVAVEHLFNFGERWRRYERTAARLQAEGWRFLQLSGPYQSFRSHSDAFAFFANQVEALNQRDVEVYNFDVVHERKAWPEADEVGGQKKSEGSPQESAGLMEPPLLMPNVVRSRSNPQRTQ